MAGERPETRSRTVSLRSGFTTGTCAAAAAKAACLALALNHDVREVDVSLPDGRRVVFSVLNLEHKGENAVSAAVQKDAGDDPDVTDGAVIVATVAWSDTGSIQWRAGEGVGTVTRPGLQIPPGEPAINPVPRAMIEGAIREVTTRPVLVEISIPGGEKLAEKTFNPRLGIVGGLSILGTSGRVVPFSHPALEESLACSLDVALASGIQRPVFVPGNIGRKAALGVGIGENAIVEVSNLWGYMLELAVEKKVQGLLAIGHPGKMAKLIEGHFDTHSKRSPSPVPMVHRVAKEIKIAVNPQIPTVEGIFQSLMERQASNLAKELAIRIKGAIEKRIAEAFAVAVLLIDMKAGFLGGSGDTGKWGLL